jgi:hypothetical protein
MHAPSSICHKLQSGDVLCNEERMPTSPIAVPLDQESCAQSRKRCRAKKRERKSEYDVITEYEAKRVYRILATPRGYLNLLLAGVSEWLPSPRFFCFPFSPLAAGSMSCPHVTVLDSTRFSPEGPSGQQWGETAADASTARQRWWAVQAAWSTTGLVRLLSLDHATCRSWLRSRWCLRSAEGDIGLVRTVSVCQLYEYT